jgi:predicted TPR repeat methyltransferase
VLATLTATDALVICAVLGAAISMATLLHGWVRERQDKAKSERDATSVQARTNTEVIDKLHDDLTKLTETVVGRAPINSYPAVEGFMQQHSRRLEQLERVLGHDS